VAHLASYVFVGLKIVSVTLKEYLIYMEEDYMMNGFLIFYFLQNVAGVVKAEGRAGRDV